MEGEIILEKYVYAFTEGNKDMRNLLGGKGANLAEMTSIGLPVPRGFTVTTEACNAYYESGKKINEEMDHFSNLLVSQVFTRRHLAMQKELAIIHEKNKNIKPITKL